MITHEIRHSRPTDLAGALAAVAQGGTPYAGGTELLAAMKVSLMRPEHLVDLKRITELNVIELVGPRMIIGPGARHADVARHPDIRSHLPVVAAVAEQIGNPRVRWQGTFGGNVCFAEPRSDLIPVLIALGADVHLRSNAAQRVTALGELIDGPFSFLKEDDEIVTAFTVDVSDVRYQRYEQVRLVERPTAGVALVGRQNGWRLVVGSACYSPYLLEVEHPEAIDPDDVARTCDVVEDGAGSEDYKQHLVAHLVRTLRADALGVDPSRCTPAEEGQDR